MNSTELDFRALLAIIRTRWRTVVFTMLALAAVVALASSSSSPRYESTAQVLINQPDPADLVGGANASPRPERQVTEEASFIEGNAVARETAEQFGDEYEVRAEPSETADIIDIVVTGPEADTVQSAATTASELYVAARREAASADFADVAAAYDVQIADANEELDGPLDDEAEVRVLNRIDSLVQLRDDMRTAAGLATGGVTVVSEPELPEGPTSPKVARDVTLALIAGLFLGLGIAVLRAGLDQRARSRESVLVAAPDVEVLAEIPRQRRRRFSKPSITTIEDGPTAALIGDGINALRAHVRREKARFCTTTLLVVSPDRGDGKTTVATNLAIALARSGTRTILIDAHREEPAVARLLDISDEPGLASVLEGTAFAGDAAVAPLKGIPLRVVPAGDLSASADLLASNVAANLLDEIVTYFPDAVVIVDGPAARTGSAALDLARLVDGVLIVADAGSASTADLLATAERIEKLDTRVVGVVLNRVTAPHQRPATPEPTASVAPVLAAPTDRPLLSKSRRATPIQWHDPDDRNESEIDDVRWDVIDADLGLGGRANGGAEQPATVDASAVDASAVDESAN
jgi:Mrp family chromosome partitioning ATPase/capsular polysaccharide biosynthesis protein